MVGVQQIIGGVTHDMYDSQCDPLLRKARHYRTPIFASSGRYLSRERERVFGCALLA
jgi:hypothetical protein